MRDWIHVGAVVVVGLSLLVFGCLKLTDEWTPAVALPENLYYAIAVCEVAIPVFLMSRWRSFALWLVSIASIGAIGVSWFGPRQNCGCLGATLPIDDQVRSLILGALGVLACVGLLTSLGVLPPESPSHLDRKPVGPARR